MQGIFLSKLRIRGARIVGKSELGNILLKLNIDSPVADKHQIIMMPKDLVLFESIRSRGSWDMPAVNFLSAPLNYANGKKIIKSYTFLDIGANSGLIVRQIAKLAKRNFKIVCVEPLPINLEALKFNTSALPNVDSVEIYPYALGDENSELEIFSEKANLGNTSLVQMDGKSVIRTLISQASTLDFIDKYLLDDSRVIIKCDTQGYESKILSQLPKKFWNRIECGVIEIRSIPMLNEKYLELILISLSDFSYMYWGDDFLKNRLTILEVKEFWLSGINEERDLFFSRQIMQENPK